MSAHPLELKRTATVAALEATPFFSGLGVAAIRRLAACFEPCVLAGGRTLFGLGDQADAVYVVVAGRLRASIGDRDIGEIGPGEVVGETALLAGVTRTATVRAIRDCELLRLSSETFLRVIRDHPDVLRRMAASVAERAARPASAARAPVRTVAVVPAGDGTDLEAFCRTLADALRRHGSVRTVHERTVRRAVGRGGEDRTLGWLQDAESRHRFVVYRGDPTLGAWTLRCLRQADLVLTVADAAGSAEPGPVEDAVADVTQARRELVLLWTGRPAGTAAWLRRRDVSAHHHVTAETGLDRLARRIAGRSTGLVLGGGGARGFAHLGVMRALDEAGIAVDAVAGTSIGAIMGACFAIGWDDATRVRKAVDAFVRTRRLVGPTFPLVSFSSSKTITRLLRDYLGDTAIEDLVIPFMCVSANLSTDEKVVHERGPVWLAVRASASLPGVLPPVCLDDGSLLVDGGVVDNLPVKPMRERIVGSVIACDIEPASDLRVTETLDPTLSGWRVLGRKINPFATSMDVPNAIEVIMRAKEVGGRRAQITDRSAEPADLVLRPPTGGVGMLDFKAGQELIELGYRSAVEQLAGWDHRV